MDATKPNNSYAGDRLAARISPEQEGCGWAWEKSWLDLLLPITFYLKSF